MTEPIITIPQGTLKGCNGTDINGGEFFKFLGIPYAKPPVGDLRFKAPLPAEKWEGTRDATKESTPCYSTCEITLGMVGSEDCLFLNVFTKNISQQNLKPVMVFIHGGGFTYGSNSTMLYGPEVLLTEDVVLVTINYRTGLLGFLSLEDTSLEVPGNAGLKDQCMALKWVHNNIKTFNGDPNNVTIFGESAGSASVHYLVLSPMAKGLFHKAIMQSGSSLNPWAVGKYQKPSLLKAMSFDEKSDKELLKDLRELPVDKLLEYQYKLGDGLPASKVRAVAPVIEKLNKDAFITQHPIEIMTSGNYNHVPLMIGYNDKEGLFLHFAKNNNPNLNLDNWEVSIPWTLKYPLGSHESKNLSQNMKQVYNAEDDNENQYNIQTDVLFLIGIIASVRNHVKTTKCPIYFYRMSIVTELNRFRKLLQISDDIKGVCHADDLGYLFQGHVTPVVEKGSREDIGRHRFCKLWTNFAIYGNPTPLNNDLDVSWEPVTRDSLNFIDIGEDLTVQNNPESERMKFWENVYKNSLATSKYF